MINRKKNHIYSNKGKKNIKIKNNIFLYGVVSKKNLTLSEKNLKLIKFFLKKSLKKSATIFLKIFLTLNNTKKPIETRMGKGKGNIETRLVYIKENEIIFLIKKKSNISYLFFENILNILLKRLSNKFKLIKKNI